MDIIISDEAFTAWIAYLESSPRVCPKLRALFAEPAPWELTDGPPTRD